MPIRSLLLTLGCTRDLQIHLALRQEAGRSLVQLPVGGLLAQPQDVGQEEPLREANQTMLVEDEANESMV